MARIPTIDPKKRASAARGPSGSAFAAVQAGDNAIAQGVADMGAALSAFGESTRIASRQDSEVEYAKSSQEIVELAKTSEGSSTPAALEQARKGLEKLRKNTLKGAWGKTQAELTGSIASVDLRSEANLLSHGRGQQKVARGQSAEAQLELGMSEVNQAPPGAVVAASAVSTQKLVANQMELYYADTGQEMPRESQYLVGKATMGSLTLNGFLQKFSEDPVSAMEAWDKDKEKLRSMMDAKNYAALEAKSDSYRSEVAYIHRDAEMRTKFSDPATGTMGYMDAARYQGNPQNWDEGTKLSQMDNMRLADSFAQAASMERQQAHIRRVADQESTMVQAAELIQSGDQAEVDNYLNKPEVRNILSFSQRQTVDNLQKAGMWTGEDTNSLQFDILSGKVTSVEGIMARMNSQSPTVSGFASLLPGKNTKDPLARMGLPNNFTKIDSFLKDQIYSYTTDAGKRRDLIAKYTGQVRSAALSKWAAAGNPSVYGDETLQIVMDSIGTIEKYVKTEAGLEEAPRFRVPVFGAERIEAPSGLVQGGGRPPARENVAPFNANDVMGDLEKSPEQAAMEISQELGKDYNSVLTVVRSQRGE